MPATESTDVDVLIIGSGPAGSMYARTIGDAVPTARILMVELGPEVPGVRGDHTQNMSDEDRAAAERAELRPWTASTKDHFVRIRPSRVTGRSFAFGPDPADRAPSS